MQSDHCVLRTLSGGCCSFCFIGADWLERWAGKTDPIVNFAEAVDGRSFYCKHGKVDPARAAAVRHVSAAAYIDLHARSVHTYFIAEQYSSLRRKRRQMRRLARALMLVWLALRGPAVISACRYGGDPFVEGRTLLCKRCTGTSRLSGHKASTPIVAAHVPYLPAVCAEPFAYVVVDSSPQSRRVSLLCCAVPLKSLIQLHCCRSARRQTSRRSTAMRCALGSIHCYVHTFLFVCAP
jgi:hypothetical protein